jgi:lysophospholipase L1-like esterase
VNCFNRVPIVSYQVLDTIGTLQVVLDGVLSGYVVGYPIRLDGLPSPYAGRYQVASISADGLTYTMHCSGAVGATVASTAVSPLGSAYAQDLGGSGSTGPYNGSNYIAHARALCYDKFILPPSYAFCASGRNAFDTNYGLSAQITNLFAKPLTPKFVVIDFLINDINAGTYTNTDITTLYIAQFKRLKARGIVPVLMACLPYSPSSGITTSTTNQRISAVNRLFNELARTNNFLFVDATHSFALKSNKFGCGNPALYREAFGLGLHPNVSGAVRIGRVLASALNPFLTSGVPTVGGLMDEYDSTYNLTGSVIPKSTVTLTVSNVTYANNSDGNMCLTFTTNYTSTYNPFSVGSTFVCTGVTASGGSPTLPTVANNQQSYPFHTVIAVGGTSGAWTATVAHYATFVGGITPTGTYTSGGSLELTVVTGAFQNLIPAQTATTSFALLATNSIDPVYPQLYGSGTGTGTVAIAARTDILPDGSTALGNELVVALGSTSGQRGIAINLPSVNGTLSAGSTSFAAGDYVQAAVEIAIDTISPTSNTCSYNMPTIAFTENNYPGGAIGQITGITVNSNTSVTVSFRNYSTTNPLAGGLSINIGGVVGTLNTVVNAEQNGYVGWSVGGGTITATGGSSPNYTATLTVTGASGKTYTSGGFIRASNNAIIQTMGGTSLSSLDPTALSGYKGILVSPVHKIVDTNNGQSGPNYLLIQLGMEAHAGAGPGYTVRFRDPIVRKVDVTNGEPI